MSTGTRNFTSIPRSYIYDLALNSIKDSFAREAFLRLKMMVDNCGRAPGDPSVIAGLLYPGNPPTRKKMSKVIKTWEESGLVMYFQGHGQWFIEVADNYETLRIAGNMKTESGFPEAPPKVVKRWERRFKQKHERKWKRVRNPNTVDTQSEHGTDQVRTQSELSTQQVSLKRRSREGQEKREEENGREGSAEGNHDNTEQNRGADAPVGPDEPTFSLSDLGRGMTICDKIGFDRKIGFKGYEEKDRFLQELSNVWKQDDIPSQVTFREIMMSHVVNRCGGLGFKVPPGWIKLLNDARREIKAKQGAA